MLRQGCSLAVKPRSSILSKSYGKNLQYSKNLQIVVSRPKISVSRNQSNFQWTSLNVSPKLFEQRRTYASLPNHSELGLPALSPTMEKGNLAKWKKKEGDKITAGDVIAEIETDKATVDFEAADDGYLAKILYEEGTKDLDVNTPIAIIVEDIKDVAAFKDYKKGAAAPKAAPKAEAAPAAEPTPAPKAESAAPAPKPAAAPAPTGRVIPGAPPPPVARKGASSPAARSTAAEEGINISGIQGTGPNGRIIKADVLDAKSRPQQAASAPRAQAVPVSSGSPFTDIPNTQIRRVIASRLSLSKQTIPHYYLTMECRVDKLLELRTKLNESANGKFKLSVNDFVVKASALALKKVPEANSSWTDEAIRRFHTVDINVAVATDKGLLTPLIPNADRIGLSTINQSVKQLADKGKEGKLSPAELTTGTFTISNLGMFGIKQFAAVINPPQACILAVGTTEKRLIPSEGSSSSSGEYAVGQFLTVTLSCDHRVVDGAVGAQWLQAFKEYMEDPTKMLL